MRGKSPLVIIELVIMLLVFALAAALCLGAFALAEDISERSAQRSDAATMAQNCAEILHRYGGDMEKSAEVLGGSCFGGELRVEKDGLALSVSEAESGHELLGAAHISVVDSSGAELFAFNCAWQKEVRADG